jgi:hypothetical protein
MNKPKVTLFLQGNTFRNMEENKSDMAKRLGISRKTLYKHIKDGTLDSVTPPESVTPVTPEVLPPEMSVTCQRMSAGFIPNWKRNGYKSANEATQTALQMVIDRVPEAVMIYQGEVFGG